MTFFTILFIAGIVFLVVLLIKTKLELIELELDDSKYKHETKYKYWSATIISPVGNEIMFVKFQEEPAWYLDNNCVEGTNKNGDAILIMGGTNILKVEGSNEDLK